MKIKSVFLFVLYYGLTCFRGVLTEQQPEIKRGDYPYMAFIYFADPSVTDAAGQRFMRSAVMIRSDWLLTAAMGETFINADNGFPRKTLLARAGAISVDSNFTLNEDEDEQEREIVEIVRPLNLSATQWWTTDISLMKTLFPFKQTAAVGVKALDIKRDLIEKTCSILVFAKQRGNSKTADEKHLTMLLVEILTPSIDSCGSHFSETTMICAKDIGEVKDVHEQFCHGNSGGPLICSRAVVGLQTYIDNNCQQPHLYQLLSAWDTFITCGIENKCNEEHCGNICDVTHKDPTPTINDQSSTTEYVPTTQKFNITTLSFFSNKTETEVMETFLMDKIGETVTTSLVTGTTERTVTKEAIQTSESGSPTLTTLNNTIDGVTSQSLMPMRRFPPHAMPLTTKKTPESPAKKPKPKGKGKGKNKKTRRQDDDDGEPKAGNQKAKGSSARNMYIIDTLFFGLLVLVCL